MEKSFRFVSVKILIFIFSIALFSLTILHTSAATSCVTDAYGYSSCQETSSSDTGEAINNGVFNDVTDYEYSESVQYVYDQGIVNGYSDGTFRPRNLINRAEFIKILVEAVSGSPAASFAKSCFSDVARSKWFSKYVCYAKENDIIGGYPDGEFKPSNNVNFAEAAKIIINSFKLSYRDLERGEKWFAPYVLALAERKAIPGNISSIDHLLSRGDMAELIMRIKEDDTSNPSLKACDLISVLCPIRYRPFADIASSPYVHSIEFLQRRGVVSGYSDRTFRPNDPINRAEIVKIILGSIGLKEVENGFNCFEDVSDEWFASHVCYAKVHNMIKGYNDGSFRPGQYVNMVEALKMVAEIFNLYIPKARSGQEWYGPYVDFAHNKNIFSKYSYFPDELITREEMAYLVQKLMFDKSKLQSFTKTRDSRSVGCGKALSADIKDTLSDWNELKSSIFVQGVERFYLANIPSTYDENIPLALTFAFHGRTDGYEEIGHYGIDSYAQGKTIVVNPAAIPERWSYSWDLERDTVFFDQLLENLTNDYCIDLDRIYVVGHSLGAWMANSISCVRGNVIRAAGTVGGGTTFTECTGPVAAVSMHNPNDSLSPFSSGLSARDRYLEQNSCSKDYEEYPGPEKANCVKYTKCANDAPVIWCPHTEDNPFGSYYPHGWPGFAKNVIWDFFESLD